MFGAQPIISASSSRELVIIHNMRVIAVEQQSKKDKNEQLEIVYYTVDLVAAVVGKNYHS